MFKKFQLVARNTRHALATGVYWCVNLYMVFAGVEWQLIGTEFGVMFTGEIKNGLQKGQNLVLTDGKGRNGFENTRHWVIFFRMKGTNRENWHPFWQAAPHFFNRPIPPMQLSWS